MPLLRNLKMRLFDNYVKTRLTSLVRNDYQSQFDLGAYGGSYPATHVTVDVPAGYVHNLEDNDCIIGLDQSPGDDICYTTGHIHGASVDVVTECLFFGTQFECPGYLTDEDNDELLLPNEDGEFSISFWLNPYIAPPGIYSILAKKIASVSSHRFLIQYDSTGASPVISFSAAITNGASELSVEASIVSERWSLVVARCSKRKLSLNVLCSDGFVAKEKTIATEDMGCDLPGETLFLGVSSDAVSNRLDSGSFYIQQVCFWDKVIDDSEEIELFSLGRGKTRFSDLAVPETFGAFGINSNDQRFKYGSTIPYVSNAWYVDLDSSGKVTKVYENNEISPYIPCKTCDSEPFCYPNAMMDPSPDAITMSVSWTPTPTGCIPEETTFTMSRLPRQIVQGFIFGRTFESEKIVLPCGGYIRFFLESTPYHWSKYRYRQYLGMEFGSVSGSGVAKFGVTMGVALVRNSVTGGSNKFTSPSPAGVSFDFPYSDSFDDYASDIVFSGWTDQASTLLYEDFPGETCANNTIDAACIVADKYRFGTGVDYPELRGGDCGWQMGVSEVAYGSSILGSQDSKYNYKVSCLSPSVLNNTRVVPYDPLLNRPFSAIARGLIGIHDKNGYKKDSELPFTNFSAVLSAKEFVRPQPFSNLSLGGCVDCTVSSTFDYDTVPPSLFSPVNVTTREITTTQCPQKTLSGAAPSVLSGATGTNPAGSGLLAAIGSPPQEFSLIAYKSRYRDLQGDTSWPNHLGGTLRANGTSQFTSQINDYDELAIDDPFLVVDTKSATKINPNTPGTIVSKIKKGTRVLPWVVDPATLVHTIPTDNTQIKRFNPDRRTSSGLATRLTPVDGTQEITVSDCSFSVQCRDNTKTAKDVVDHNSDPVSEFTTDDDFPSGSQDSGVYVASGMEYSFSGGVNWIGSPSGGTCVGDPVPGTRPTYTFPIASGSGAGTFCGTPITNNNCGSSGSSFVTVATQETEIEINSFVVRYDCERERNIAEISYSLFHTERLSVTVDTSMIVTSDGCGSVGTTEISGGVAFYIKHNRLATFVQDWGDNKCFTVSEAEHENIGTLSFESDELVSKESFNGDGPDTTQAEADQKVIDFFFASVNPFFGVPTITGTSLSLTVTYPLFLVPCDSCSDPVTNPVITITGTASTVTGLLPDSLDPIRVFDFSNSYVGVTFSESEVIPEMYPDSYEFSIKNVSEVYNRDYVLTPERGTMLWRETVQDYPYLLTSLNVQSLKLEIFREDEDCVAENGVQVAARYRLEGFPYSRWNRNGDNQMRLVSADWSIGKWPIYITVSPTP